MTQIELITQIQAQLRQAPQSVDRNHLQYYWQVLQEWTEQYLSAGRWPGIGPAETRQRLSILTHADLSAFTAGR